jgi:predicted dehydrogenase
MIQLAFLGLAHIHTPGFIASIRKRDNIGVKSVWDHDVARAQLRAEELGAAVVDDYRILLKDKEIEAVIVCSETNIHEELVLAAVKAKKHLFVEKPLGMGVKDSYRMARAIEKARLMFQTGYFSRGFGHLNFLREQVQAGAFGQITRVRGSNCHGGALKGWFDTDWRWMADPAIAGVGAFGDLGTHALDVLLWIMGDVEAVTASLSPGISAYGDCDETGEGLLRFKNGAIGTLAAGWDDVTNPVSYIISGTEAHAAIIHNQLFYHRRRPAEELTQVIKELEAALNAPDKPDAAKQDLQRQLDEKRHLLEIESGRAPWPDIPPNIPAGLDAFLDALAGDVDAQLVTAREAAYRCAVMSAMYKAAKKDKWVEPKVK